ncbi:hypothetical protein DFH28DRAFT_1122354 [Melampsora americana]|nr:hypothetical protein DFH28DRAFT_1122354 [Melampsora americana]
MSHHHSQNPRNFNPLNKQTHSAPSRHPQPSRHLNPIRNRSVSTTPSHELKSGHSQKLDEPQNSLDQTKMGLTFNPNPKPQNSLDQTKMGLTFNLNSTGLNPLPKLPKFKRLQHNQRPNPISPTITSHSTHPSLQPLNKHTPKSSSRSSDHSSRPTPLFPHGVNQIPLGKSNRSPWNNASSSSKIEDDEVPIKSPPKRNQTNHFRRKKGSEVSTEPTKTRRTAQSGSNGQSSGPITKSQDAGDETEEDLELKDQTVTASRPPSDEKVSKLSDLTTDQAQNHSPSVSQITPVHDTDRVIKTSVEQGSFVKSANHTNLIGTLNGPGASGSGSDTVTINTKPSDPLLKSLANPSDSNGSQHKRKNDDTSRSERSNSTHAQSGSKPNKPTEIDTDSSLSSLSSDGVEEEDSSDSSSSISEDTIEIAAPPFVAVVESQALAQSDTILNDNKLLDNLTETIPSTLERRPETSPSRAPITDVVMDDASELGEDVCLEYTDFGANELGVPVTWSESEYDEGEKSDETDEFAEFLLMEASDYDLTDMNRFQSIDHDLGENFDLESHLGSDSGGSSQTGYMIIEEFESLQTHEPDEEEIEEEEEDGETTDSLDEDDHSGLVKFGIEVDDDEEEDDATFFDLPPDSALGSLLTNFELSGDVEFFVLPEDESANPSPQATRQIIESPSISTSCLLPAPPGSSTTNPVLSEMLGTKPEIQLPVMGSFSVGKSAGRTIIDEKAIPPVSPFTGGKVIRYNRFKKLRDRSCGNESERSSLGTPKADSNHPAEQSAPEDDFDITAFIHGISSKDDEEFFDFGNKGRTEGIEEGVEKRKLDDLSRWRRVPMTAFRMSNEPVPPPIILDGAIQPSARAGQKTLSLVQQSKLNGKSLLNSPHHRKSKKKRGHRTEEIVQHHPERKRGRIEEEEELRLAINSMFDTPLFKSMIERNEGIEGGGVDEDVPMLNLMDGIEGLPIE